MPVETQLELLFDVIEGGKAVTGEVVPFPSDAGVSALEGITETVELGNGVATEVSQLTAVEGGATTTAGVGVLGVEVGAVGAILAPALGLIAGKALYDLTPDFWTEVSDVLMHQGETVNGMVRCYLNATEKTVGFSESTIEIFKNAFLNAGCFDSVISYEITPETEQNYYHPELLQNGVIIGCSGFVTTSGNVYSWDKKNNAIGFFSAGYSVILVFSDFQEIGCDQTIYLNGRPWGENSFTNTEYFNDKNGNRHLVSRYFYSNLTNASKLSGYYNNLSEEYKGFDNREILASDVYTLLTSGEEIEENDIQEDAIIPDEMPFPQKYPTWTPYTLPDETTKVYPVEIPVVDPNPLQAPAQNPQPLPDNDPALLDWLINAMNLPKANPAIQPAPLPAIDPDPQPAPEPINEPTKPNTKPDPVDPNPEPTTPFLPIVPQLPDTVPANAMFTVYKPTIAQVNAFGGWLWSNNILEMIKRIWQNPLDGIIAFMKVYVDAPTSGSDTIKVGVLDSEVSSAVVSGQFVTVECGSIDIEEKNFNATDYSPFVALHLYLPFIGIVELDIDEFMGGNIKVTYHVDVYTGTCLAEVKAKRNHDMDDYTIVYTFSGNASQQLPLTSAEFGGALSALVGVVGGGLAIASGGGLGLLAGASGIAHAVTHEMVHLAHSGSLSANAGIMGARTPYLIITRRRGYDANGYNQIYGYPSNKTVYLNNCSGFVRVKDIQLKTGATDLESNEIVSLLKNGVII